MKSLLLAFLLTLSASCFADQSYSVKASDELNILNFVVGITTTYSPTSELEAKAVEIIGGDGMNPLRIAIIFSTGMANSYGFMLNEMITKVTRVTFLAKDTIVINYIQETFDSSANTITVKKSVTVKANRLPNGTLANSITVKK